MNEPKASGPALVTQPTAVRKIFDHQGKDQASNEDILTLNKTNMVDLDTIFDADLKAAKEAD